MPARELAARPPAVFWYPPYRPTTISKPGTKTTEAEIKKLSPISIGVMVSLTALRTTSDTPLISRNQQNSITSSTRAMGILQARRIAPAPQRRRPVALSALFLI